jgi:hypothetical protein
MPKQPQKYQMNFGLYDLVSGGNRSSICGAALKLAQGSGVRVENSGNDSNLLIVFYVQIMPDDLVM